MAIRRILAVGTALAALVTTAACAGGDSTDANAAYNAASTTIVDPSSHTGGTLVIDNADDFDSADPGNLYFNDVWDLSQLYERPLVTYARKPGKAGLQLVPDLATSLGTPSDGGKTWTYHIRKGVKYSNGQTVTSADVKYAVERSNWGHSVLSLGPNYFLELIDPKAASGGQSWPGPYVDKTGSLPDSMIATPDPYTIVFHLVQPFAEFDNVVTLMQTAPVPRSADTGVNYEQHPLSTGAYKLDSYKPGVGATMSRNPYWDPSTDPLHLHPQLVNNVEVHVKVDPNAVDNRLMSGQSDLDMSGQGVQEAAQEKVLTNSQLRKNVDDPETGFVDYATINLNVKPFTNINCRKAVEYGANKVELQNQFGGPTGGSIANTILPPTVNGYAAYPNPYPTPGNQGDLPKARSYLNTCKSELGSAFTPDVNIAARSDKPKEVAAATALSQQLNDIGFKSNLEEFPSATYFADFAGAPAYANSHSLGVMFETWAADWPDAYAWFEETVNGETMTAAGNHDLSQLNDPQINHMIDSAAATLNTQQRNAQWSKVDQAIMKQAVILPIVDAKALLYRPPALTNVTVSDVFGMYNYVMLGLKK